MYSITLSSELSVTSYHPCVSRGDNNDSFPIVVHEGNVGIWRDNAFKGDDVMPIFFTPVVTVVLPWYFSPTTGSDLADSTTDIRTTNMGCFINMCERFEEAVCSGAIDLTEYFGGGEIPLTDSKMPFSFLSFDILSDDCRKTSIAVVNCVAPSVSRAFNEFVNFEWMRFSKGDLPMLDSATPNCDSTRRYAALLVRRSENGCSWSPVPPPDHYELPNCSVCLARLETNITGLQGWEMCSCFPAECTCLYYSECRVCQQSIQYLQAPVSQQTSRSLVCTVCETDQDVWQCLVCGVIGCSRYRFRHAADHFSATGHEYSMCLASQEIWDYRGDNFVHRVVMRISSIPDSLPSKKDSLQTSQASKKALKTENLILGLFGDNSSSGGKWNFADEYLDPQKHGKYNNEALKDSLTPDRLISDKYDAKVEYVCTEYTNMLTEQLLCQRQHFEEQLEPLYERARDAQSYITQGESPKEMEVEMTCLENALEEFKQSNKELTALQSEQKEAKEKESALQQEITRTKQAIKTIMEVRQREVKERDSRIQQLQEEKEELLLNLKAKTEMKKANCVDGQLVLDSRNNKAKNNRR